VLRPKTGQGDERSASGQQDEPDHHSGHHALRANEKEEPEEPEGASEEVRDKCGNRGHAQDSTGEPPRSGVSPTDSLRRRGEASGRRVPSPMRR
jgi:hypothetical protein